MPRIVKQQLDKLKNYPDNPNKHSKKQIQKLAGVMRRLGFIGVIVVDESGYILAGHARREAALVAGIAEVDCVLVDYLSDAEKRAFVLADNRIGLDATTDLEKMSLNLKAIALSDPSFDLSLTGFEADEIDRIVLGSNPDEKLPLLRDEVLPELSAGAPICRVGDLVLMGEHRLYCGDSRQGGSFAILLENELAAMVVSDAPYNLRIAGHVGGSGNIKHHEFVMGSGELTTPDFVDFLSDVNRNLVGFSADGSIHYLFMDWRHQREMLDSAEPFYAELKNVIIWDKGVGGQGSFYRSRHELIYVFKNGNAPHINNFGLGEKGRYRTNVWSYRGLNTGGAGRLEELTLHPTAKPVQMLADAMLDCSRRNSIVVDPFGGSGSTLIAAEKSGRRARLIELDPIYCDRIVRRWQTFARDDAVFLDSGETFREREIRLRHERSVVRPGRSPTSRIVDFSMEVRP